MLDIEVFGREHPSGTGQRSRQRDQTFRFPYRCRETGQSSIQILPLVLLYFRLADRIVSVSFQLVVVVLVSASLVML